ncbi:hypothetical protein D3C77_324880 [compost metagenome]
MHGLTLQVQPVSAHLYGFIHQADGAHVPQVFQQRDVSLGQLGHVFQALHLGHRGELIEKLTAVHWLGRVLVADLRHHQFDEGVLHLTGSRVGFDPLIGLRTARPIVLHCTHYASPSLSKPCCMLLIRLSTSTPVSKLRVADIMSVISSISLISG